MAFHIIKTPCHQNRSGFLFAPTNLKPLGHVCLQLAMWTVTVIASANWCPAQTDLQSHVPVKKISTQLRGFGVPFNVDANDSEFIEVHLYVTKDQGKSWQFYGRQSTEDKEFPFQAEGDGEYWFALKTLNKDRKLLPEGDIQPELKVVVDTVKPTMTCDINSDPAGRIVCKWIAKDHNIDSASLKILYRPDVAPGLQPLATTLKWKTVPITLESTADSGVFKDQLAWWPDGNSRSYQVRMIVTDSAGNAVHQDSRVVVPLVAWRSKTKSTAVPGGGWKQNSNATYSVVAGNPGKNFNGNIRQNRTPVPSPPVHSSIAGKQRMVCEGGVCRPVGPNEKHDMENTSPIRLVGSKAEFAAPPVPEDHDDQKTTDKKQLADTNYPPFKAKSIPWAGKVEDPTGIHDLASSSTISSNQSMTLPSSATSEIRSLPPQPVTNDSRHASLREFPGGLIVAESTAARKPFVRNQVAQFDANTKPDWQGKGETAIAKSVPEYSTRKESPQGWLNEQVVSAKPPKTRSQAEAQLAKLPTYNANKKNPAQPIGYRSPSTAPNPMPLNMPKLEAMQHINKRRFNLNYNVDAIDPSGVDKVNLWMTRDGGRTWKSWGTDPDGISPFPVEVDQAGIYGFRVVIQSRDGLTGITPRRGDQPDMWINIDTKAPMAKILSVPYGRGHEAGRLVINWEAEDPLMTFRPITLAYATDPQGPWTAIENGLRNTGRYVWKVGSEVPERVFLRLEAVDEAGNVGVFQLNNLIDLSGLVPRGRIMSVDPVGS